MKKYKEVPISKLRWQCNENLFDFKTTKDIKLSMEIIGQSRAVNAMELGLDIKNPGYNTFVSGLTGTGRTTTTKLLIEKTERIKNIPDDKCYVNNFKDTDSPNLITLKAGRGGKFKRDMDELIEWLVKNIPSVFESDAYKRKKNSVIEKHKEKQNKLLKNFEDKVARENFALIQVQVGPFTKPDLIPVIDKKPANFKQLRTLARDGKIDKKIVSEMEEKYTKLSIELEDILKKARDIERETKSELQRVNHDTITPFIEHRLKDINNKYKNKEVDNYLKTIKESVLENLERFRNPKKGDIFSEYRINLVVDNSNAKKAPVIFETSPSYKNLFGTIERQIGPGGKWKMDHTMIKSGSLVKANGGFLILNALDVLVEPGVWNGLKRSLKNRRVEVQTFDPFYMLTVSALKPEPIPIDVKVVMIGDPELYYLLYTRDADFKKIFKLRADFDSTMNRDKKTIYQYASFIRSLCEKEHLLPFDSSAVSRIVEYGIRLAGRQNKISTKFNNIADVLRESNYWARKAKRKLVKRIDVKKAIKEKIERERLTEEKIQEMIKDGTLLIDTEGSVVGQVNGLAVYTTGEYSFGKPSRITAKTAVGGSGIINIEREVKLSGPIYNKAVLILSGYLRSKYAQNKPLVLSASICFEQSYGGVEGDSASSAEVYSLLSSLSGLPLRQDIAVTGSVNQKGEIQPIGGVNQKIEGFYDVCKIKRLTGTQAVIIPEKNVEDLMLEERVINSVNKREFRIYPVKTINEGIEILTGVKAGRIKDGKYEEGTVNWLVDKRLEELANEWKKFREVKPIEG